MVRPSSVSIRGRKRLSQLTNSEATPRMPFSFMSTSGRDGVRLSIEWRVTRPFLYSMSNWIAARASAWVSMTIDCRLSAKAASIAFSTPGVT